MIITEIEPFLDYFGKIRKRTDRVIEAIPHDMMDWTYKEGRFTLGDVVRHLAAIERFMYAENVQLKPTAYIGCGKDLAETYQEIMNYYQNCHQDSLEIFEKLSPNQLQQKCLTPAGIPITIWKWLRAMIEHEIHHRGQIYIYLSILGVKSPPLYGLTSEELIEISSRKDID